MNFFHVLILALVQGAAELLPVSSSAHVILAEHWLGLDPSAPEMVFLLVMLHTGTMGAVLLFFRKRWMALLRQDFKALIKVSVISTVATGVLGLALKSFIEKILLGGGTAEIEDLFRSRNAVGFALLAAGLLIFVSGRLFAKTQNEKESPQESFHDSAPSRTLAENGLTVKSSLAIGLVQGLCLPFRGFSRSGATISTALLFKVRRNIAEDYSFLLAVIITPPVILRSVHKLHKAAIQQGVGIYEMSQQVLIPGLFGACFSFAAGLLALKFLSGLLEKGKWSYFGVYCFFIALIMFSGI